MSKRSRTASHLIEYKLSHILLMTGDKLLVFCASVFSSENGDNETLLTEVFSKK